MGRSLAVLAILCAVVGLAIAEKDHDTGVSMIVVAVALGLLSFKSVRESLTPNNLTTPKVIFLVAVLALIWAMFEFGPVTVIDKIITWFQEAGDGIKKGQNGT